MHPDRLEHLAAGRLALDARDRREGRRDRHRLEEASRQRQMTCQRFKTDSCLCTGPAKLRGGNRRPSSSAPPQSASRPPGWLPFTFCESSEPRPRTDTNRQCDTRFLEFGICGARNAAFCESALEVAGWERRGTFAALLLCWPLRRLPPGKRTFLAFFFLRFFFLRDVLHFFLRILFFCESLRRQMHFLRISHDRRGLLLRLLLLLFLLGLGLLRLLRLLRRLLGGLLRLHVLWVEQNRLLPTRLRHVGLSKTRFLFTT